MSMNVGRVVGVNGNLLTVEFDSPVTQNEMGYAHVQDLKLKCEVIRIRGRYAEMQVFEDTTGLRIGDQVEFTGDLLTVELGPGLLTQIYDGLQNPLPELAAQGGFFLFVGVLYRKVVIRRRRCKQRLYIDRPRIGTVGFGFLEFYEIC